MTRPGASRQRSARLTVAVALMAIPAAVGALGACSQDVTPPPVRNLDRPSSVAFACYGDLRVNGGDPTADGDLVVSAQPIASCQAQASGTPPEGQEDLVAPHLYGFVLQSARGTVAVVDNQAGAVIDSDPLTPGKNSIPIGTLPVGLTPDRSGCYMVSANAGSCDMTSLDVTSALDISRATSIARVPITTSTGDLLRAKPSTVIGGTPDDTIGVACPDTPTGPLYVAYPTCHLVAVVDAATGVVQGGIQFAEDGTATITDGAVSCPQECGDGSITPSSGSTALVGEDAAPGDAGPAADAGPPPVIDQGGPRPVVLHLGADGRLYVGSENSPIITSVGLDDSGMPTDVSDIRLEGDVGVTAMDVSDQIIEGGSLGTFGTGGGGMFRFLYAVATDRTVRAVDLTHMQECDTAVDPRYLHDIRDVARLSCLPVGDPDTPPRRAGATSPGIQLPRGAAPLGVAFVNVAPPNGVSTVSPTGMVGTFAFVSSSDGIVYVVNVDDDKYPDFENADAPYLVSMPLAIPHQLRDFATNRAGLPESCATPSGDPLQLGPRLSSQPGIGLSEDSLVQEKLDLAPTLHQVSCTTVSDSGLVNELAFGAPSDVRELAWPDLRPIQDEDWSIEWEGSLSRDSSAENIDGPPVRSALLTPGAGGTTTLADPTSSLCQTGVEPYDIVDVLGCDPAQGDAQCGIGETCYVHPDAPTVVTRGQCLPAAQLDTLSGTCRDFLISKRRYAATSTAADHLTLVPRRRVLRTSPVGGCASDQQCADLADLVPSLTDPAHPAEAVPPQTLPSDTYDYVCRPDPTRAADDAGQPVNRCQIACESSDDCEPGMACGSAGLCVEGVPPPAACVAAAQRYQVRASDAFVVIGSRTGYLHNRIRDPDTGECVADPDASPLLRGRIPLTAPACTGAGLTDLSPNPCSTTVQQSEDYVPYVVQGGHCVSQADVVRDRDAQAIRLMNPVFTLNLVDPTTTGDKDCIGDRMGTYPPFSAVYPGFQLAFTVTGGFFPMFVTSLQAAYPIQVVASPDGQLWVLDEGDASSATLGRVFTLVPADPGNGFDVITIL